MSANLSKLLRIFLPLNPQVSGLRDPKDAKEYAATDRARRQGLDRIFGTRAAGDLIMPWHADYLAEHGNSIQLGDSLGLRRLIAKAQAAFDVSRMQPVGAVNGGSSAAYPGCGVQGSPNSVHYGDADCNRKTCTEDAFNIFSRGKPGFPLAGTAAAYPAVALATIVDQKPTQSDLLPTRVWAVANDTTPAAQPVVQGFIDNIQIGNTTQFLGNRLPTTMFGQIQDAVPVQWDTIYAAIGCNITVGHTLPAAVTEDFYITIWGVPNPTSRTQ